jgi:hypothetical protein
MQSVQQRTVNKTSYTYIAKLQFDDGWLEDYLIANYLIPNNILKWCLDNNVFCRMLYFRASFYSSAGTEVLRIIISDNRPTAGEVLIRYA